MGIQASSILRQISYACPKLNHFFLIKMKQQIDPQTELLFTGEMLNN